MDYGCRAGDYLNASKKYSQNLIGIDIDIQPAQKRYPQIKFIKQKGEKIKLQSNSINQIICINTIENIYDFEFCLQEFVRILKPNGKLFITTADHNFLFYSLILLILLNGINKNLKN